MDLYTILWTQIIILFIFSIFYFILSSWLPPKSFDTPTRDWNFIFKKYWAFYKVKKWKKAKANESKHDAHKLFPIRDVDSYDSQVIWATNDENCSIYILFKRIINQKAELAIVLTLSDGTTYVLPSQPEIISFNASVDNWSAGDLKIITLEPFKRYRLLFNGFMVKNDAEKWDITEKEPFHVKFNFIWVASSHPVNILEDMSDILLAESLASEPWRNPHWMDGLTKHPMGGYDEYGSMTGIVALNNSIEPQSYLLHGVRERRWGNDLDNFVNKSLSLKGAAEDGTFYNIHIESNRMGLRHLQYGSVRLPSGDVNPIVWTDIDMYEILECNPNASKTFTFNFKGKSKQFSIIVNVSQFKNNIFQNQQSETIIYPTNIIMNTLRGNGCLQFYIRHKVMKYLDSPSEQKQQLQWEDNCNINNDEICVSFANRVSCCPQFVGAKGASLAILSSIKSEEFIVPDGFCLTIKALDYQLQDNPKIAKAIQDIEKVNMDYSENALKEHCEKVTNLFLETPICDRVSREIEIFFDQQTSSKQENMDLYFAIRSSGIGEDSEELSAAGQNATILGAKTLNDVNEAVKKCWASLYTFQSVEYRRIHGQRVHCGMGVVIQKMVNAESAGVMFTRHPTSGDPGCILITSNFGLGETVVSGQVEPDHIYLKRDLQDNVSIEKIEIGSKSHKLQLDVNTNQLKSQNLDDSSKILSLKQELILSLAKIAINQEYMWGSPRDIEWAISNGVIYLLQARPITSLQMWNEYELLHELDSPIMSKFDISTFANIGEVLPNCLSPLSCSVIADALEKSLRIAIKQGFTTPNFNAMAYTHHRAGLSVSNLMKKNIKKENDIISKVTDMAVFGHTVTDEKLHSSCLHRNGDMDLIATMINIKDIIWALWKKNEKCTEGSNYAKNFKINLDKCDDSKQMIDEIEKMIPLLVESINYHNIVTSASVFSQIIIFTLLLDGNSEFSIDNYSDIGLILSSCSNVISAEIPTGLMELAKSIVKADKIKEFCEQDPKDGVSWLKINCVETYEILENFLKRHGHRSISELDLMAETWDLNTISLIEALQTTLSAPLNTQKSEDNSDIISKLVSPMKKTTKFLLKFAIPFCQKVVTQRETTKEALILIVHKFRIAYRKLAKKMMEEWFIPDEKLVYFFTHFELHQYIKTRDPGYINKALLRRRFFSKWENYKFPEISYGEIKPITADSVIIPENGNNVNVCGTPVYPGSIIGRACVIHHISEIGSLKRGDILITHSTDIGWSPYFPLIDGVVTELGGLISHGAVVAREYGLPCIVGAQNATSIFKTGDKVLLNSTKGILQKLESTE